jgi:hypothetical protein
MTNPLDRLRYHVSGAIERGEAAPIVAVEYPPYPCNCEHPSHFPDMPAYDPTQHPYMQAVAGNRQALFVGPVCDVCADGHYADVLLPDTVVSIRDFASHADALAGQETDRKAGYKVGDWFAYQGTTSYTVTLPRELASVKLEGES